MFFSKFILFFNISTIARIRPCMHNPRPARLFCEARNPTQNKSYGHLPETFGHPYRRWFQIFLARRRKCKATSIDPVRKLVGSTRGCLSVYRARMFIDSVGKIAE